MKEKEIKERLENLIKSQEVTLESFHRLQELAIRVVILTGVTGIMFGAILGALFGVLIGGR